MLYNLITEQEIKDVLGLNIADKFKLSNQKAIERWINRQQNIVLNHIAKYNFNGIVDVELRLLYDEWYKGIIIQAVIEQIDYINYNSGVDASKINGITQRNGVFQIADKDALKSFSIAPQAEEILVSNGLLYTGGF